MPAPKARPPRTALFQHSGFAVLRTPLLSFDEHLRWGERVASFVASGSQDVPGSVETRTAPTCEESLNVLREFVSGPEFIEAVRVASPALHRAFADWLAGGKNFEANRLEQSLLRYFSRASYRCTPFGLFAGCSLVDIGGSTGLDLCPRSAYTRHSRLDMDHLAELSRVVMADPVARKRLPLYANSSATEVGGRIHYVETRYHGRVRQYSLTAVDVIPEITAVMALATEGVTHTELVAFLQDKGFESDEVDAFLDDLLESQLLVPRVEPQLTGTEAAVVLADDLDAAGCGREISDALRSVNASLRRIDSESLGVSSSEYDAALAPLDALPVPVDPSKTLQVDLFKPAPGLRLGEQLVSEVITAAELLISLSIRVDRLAEFATRFTDRYETRDVPLLEALDDEVGVGFPQLDGNDRAMRRYTERLRQRDAVLADLRVRAAREGAQEIVLDDAELARLRMPDRAASPDALSVLVTLVAESVAHVDRGEYQLCGPTLVGPSGARMVGRFAHLHPEFESRVQEHLSAEETLQPSAIFAEIVHLPQGRIGNIAARPLLRGREIEYLGRGGGDRANKIQLSDLTIAVRSGYVILRSVSHDCEVRPRMSCAHNYHSGRELPVYRFLAALQDHQTTGAISWSWGLHMSAPFLPRVRRERVILAPATWTIRTSDIKAIASRSGDAHAAFTQWRQRFGVPRFIALADGDNRIPVDCENPCSTRMLFELIRRRSSAQLEESLLQPDALCVTGPEGRFTNEIIVPLVRVAPATAPTSTPDKPVTPARLRRAAASIPRQYAPGDEWMYAKLYCGTGSGDLVIRTLVAEIVQIAQAEGFVDKWFFLRYSDPRFHIRLRLHGPSNMLPRVTEIARAVCAPALATGRLARVTFDTYQPEIERYGGAAAIATAESIFCADSELALSVLAREPDSVGIPNRELIALASFDRYFADAGCEGPERTAALERAYGNVSPAVRRARSAAFRARRAGVSRAIAQSRRESETTWLTDLLDARSAAAKPLFSTLRDLEARGELMQPLDTVLFSFTHMSFNRLIPIGRAEESALYDFLLRHYIGERERLRAARGSEAASRLTVEGA